ncbi:MAG: transposase, partial [Rhodothermales bacterium]|nr:transposase [Rhodothermales bacterium]
VQIVICLGLTVDGRKLPLGFIESTTENAIAIQGLFRDLIGRGLRFEEGLLCVIDGAKGLYKAVQKTFGVHAQVQRCQWHKRENVVGYLAKKDQDIYRRRLGAAYRKTDYPAAKEALMAIHTELEGLNRSAARSLMEGLEETLTLHRLGVFAEVGKSLKTTNGIENLNSQLTKYIGRVKNWMSSDQRQRWVAMGLLQVEKKMNRIEGWQSLDLLRAALQQQIPNSETPAENEPLADESFN